MPCVAEVVNRSLKADCTDFNTSDPPDTLSLESFPLGATVIRCLETTACIVFLENHQRMKLTSILADGANLTPLFTMAPQCLTFSLRLS